MFYNNWNDLNWVIASNQNITKLIKIIINITFSWSIFAKCHLYIISYIFWFLVLFLFWNRIKIKSKNLMWISLFGILQPQCTLNKMLSYAWFVKNGNTMGGGNLMDDVAQGTVCVAINRFNKVSIIKYVLLYPVRYLKCHIWVVLLENWYDIK